MRPKSLSCKKICGRAGRRARRIGDERGSGTALAMAAVVVLMVLTAVAMLVASYVQVAHRARAAADLAAVSGAGAHADGADACAAARDFARRNAVALSDCSVAGDQIDFVVTVTVEARIDGPQGLPRTCRVTAHAGRLDG